MTADEAKQALKEGKKVRCVKWWKPNFIENENNIFTDRGILVDWDIFEENKDDDWEIVE